MWTKVGLSGGCHWCTEAVFQSLKGTKNIQQGWLNSHAPHDNFAEGVLVEYNPSIIPLEIILSAHLSTHQSQKNHSRRDVYRSAIYYFSQAQQEEIKATLQQIEANTQLHFVTLILPHVDFKASRPEIQNYYTKGRQKPFCRQYISPKLAKLKANFTPYFTEI